MIFFYKTDWVINHSYFTQQYFKYSRPVCTFHRIRKVICGLWQDFGFFPVMVKKFLTAIALVLTASSIPGGVYAQSEEIAPAPVPATEMNVQSLLNEPFVPMPATFRRPFDTDGPANDGPEYHMSWKVDAPIIAAGTAWTLYAFGRVYNTANPVGERVDGNYKNSFFAGHVALVASTTFFTASMYDEYHPNSPFRWVAWGAATAATGYTAYLRHLAGKHFPTDIIVGAAVGTMSGIFVPKLHKTRSASGRGWAFRPHYNWTGGTGIAVNYRF
jgi:hypothetical protein